jgi:hypothetical protein
LRYFAKHILATVPIVSNTERTHKRFKAQHFKTRNRLRNEFIDNSVQVKQSLDQSSGRVNFKTEPVIPILPQAKLCSSSQCHRGRTKFVVIDRIPKEEGDWKEEGEEIWAVECLRDGGCTPKPPRF